MTSRTLKRPRGVAKPHHFIAGIIVDSYYFEVAVHDASEAPEFNFGCHGPHDIKAAREHYSADTYLEDLEGRDRRQRDAQRKRRLAALEYLNALATLATR